jgi:hypothetical protein
MLKNLSPDELLALSRIIELYNNDGLEALPDDDYDTFMITVALAVCSLGATYNDEMIRYIVQSELYRYEQAHAKAQLPVILQLTEIDEDGETVDTHRIVFRPGELNSSSCRRLGTYINNTRVHKIRVSVEED